MAPQRPAELTQNGHRVLVERVRGSASAATIAPTPAGATLSTTDEVFDEAE